MTPERGQNGKMTSKKNEYEHLGIGELVNTGATLLKTGKAQEALPYLQRAWELEPTEVAAAINLAGAYILLNRPKDAVPVLEAATELAPENAMAWMNLGAAYLGNPILATVEQQDKAIQAFEQAAQLQPGLPHVDYNIALIFRDQQKWAQACAHFQRALEVNPQDRDARMLLQQVQSRLAGEQRE